MVAIMNSSVTTGNYFTKETKGKRGSIFQVDGYTARGDRIRKRFKTVEAAQGFIHRQQMSDLRQPSRYSTQATHLTAEELKEAERCFGMLPESVSLTEAMEGFLRTYDPSVRTKAALDAFTEFLGMKESENIRQLTQDNLRRRISKFITDLGNPIVSEIGEAHVRKFLDGFTPTNSNNYRRAISQFLDFCVNREYAARNTLLKVKTKHVDREDEVTILDVTQSRKLLRAAHDLHEGEMLPYIVLALFAGLRPISEIEQIKWSDIDLKDGEIHVRRTKNRNHIRYVEMSAALLKWIPLCVGKPIVTKNHRRKLAVLKQAIGFKGALPGKRQKELDADLVQWEADTLRHTFGSYLYAEKKDVAHVATQMGNSADIVMRHYRKAVKPAEAKRFWALTPAEVLRDQKLELRAV